MIVLYINRLKMALNHKLFTVFQIIIGIYY